MNTRFLWMDVTTKNEEQRCQVFFCEASIATQTITESTNFKVSACVMQVFGGSRNLEVWSDCNKVSIDIILDDEKQVDVFFNFADAESDIKLYRIGVAAALRLIVLRVACLPPIRKKGVMQASHESLQVSCAGVYDLHAGARHVVDLDEIMDIEGKILKAPAGN
jgi:hypothetical protein